MQFYALWLDDKWVYNICINKIQHVEVYRLWRWKMCVELTMWALHCVKAPIYRSYRQWKNKTIKMIEPSEQAYFVWYKLYLNKSVSLIIEFCHLPASHWVIDTDKCNNWKRVATLCKKYLLLYKLLSDNIIRCSTAALEVLT